MSDLLIREETVGEDGKVVLELPPGKHVRIVVEDVGTGRILTSEDETAADAEFETLMSDPRTFEGFGLTAGEIVKSPEIGIWADRADMNDSVAWVENMRRQKRERRMKRD